MNRNITFPIYKLWRIKIIPITDIFWISFGFLMFMPIEIFVGSGLFFAYFQILTLFILSKRISKVRLSIFFLLCPIIVLSTIAGDEIRLTSLINPIVIGIALMINIESEHKAYMIKQGIYISAIANTFLLMYVLSQANLSTLYAMLTTRDWAADLIPWFGNGLAMSFALTMLFAAKDRNWKLLLIIIIGGILTTSRVPIFSVAIISFFYVARSISVKNLMNIIFIGILASFAFLTIFTNYNLAEQVDGILYRFMYASDRFDVYVLALSEIVENPILGAGSKNLDYFFHAHNSYLQVDYKYGVFAFALWFSLIYLSLLRGLISFKHLDFILIFVLITFFQIGLLNPSLILQLIIFRYFYSKKNPKQRKDLEYDR